jgi:hypothetical protein
LLARGIENTGHPNFFPNNTFHGCSIYACKVIGTFFDMVTGVTLSLSKSQSPFSHRPFPFWGSTGSKQTLNGLFYVISQSSFFPTNQN